MADFDALVAMGDRLDRAVGPNAMVDGHDIGSGEMNVFVFTDEPTETFATAQRVFVQDASWTDVRAAYRDLSKDEYTVLWPPGHTPFSIT
jgi:hypothetical protein